MRAWYDAHPDVKGAALTLAEAFKLGAAIFGDLMEDGATTV